MAKAIETGRIQVERKVLEARRKVELADTMREKELAMMKLEMGRRLR